AVRASARGAFGEEILCRLFLLSALLRILPASGSGTVIAVAVSSLLFAVLHVPAAVFLFGGFGKVPPLTWVWMVSLNAFVGIACAAWYLRIGIGGGILVPFSSDLVWDLLPPLSWVPNEVLHPTGDPFRFLGVDVSPAAPPGEQWRSTGDNSVFSNASLHSR